MSRLGLCILLGAGLMLLGCVSGGKYRAQVDSTKDAERDGKVLQERIKALEAQVATLTRENERLHQQFTDAQSALPKMRDELTSCQARLNTLEMVSRAELLAKNESKDELMTEKEQGAYTRGVLDVWQTLAFRGIAGKDPGVLFDDHFFTCQVTMRNRPIFQITVPTKSEQSGVMRGFSQILELAAVGKVFVPR